MRFLIFAMLVVGPAWGQERPEMCAPDSDPCVVIGLTALQWGLLIVIFGAMAAVTAHASVMAASRLTRWALRKCGIVHDSHTGA